MSCSVRNENRRWRTFRTRSNKIFNLAMRLIDKIFRVVRLDGCGWMPVAGRLLRISREQGGVVKHCDSITRLYLTSRHRRKGFARIVQILVHTPPAKSRNNANFRRMIPCCQNSVLHGRSILLVSLVLLLLHGQNHAAALR